MTKQFSKAKGHPNYSVDNSLQSFLSNIPVEKPANPTPKIPWILSCPFCGEPPSIDDGITYQEAIQVDEEHIFGCFNPKCPVQPSINGEDLDELIKRWNTRP